MHKIAPIVTRMFPGHLVMEMSHPTAAWDVGPHKLNAAMDAAWMARINEPGKQSWLGAPTHQVAFERMRFGWPEGVKDALSAFHMLDLPIVPKRRRIRYGMDGEPDVQRVQDMDPEPFRRHSKIVAPIVRLTLDFDACGYQSASDLKWKGAIATALSDALTSAGFSVEISCLNSSRWMFEDDDPPYYTVVMRVKNADDPINLPNIAGVLCSAAGFRVGIWRAYHCAPFKMAGYGCVADTPAELHGDIHIPLRITTEEAAQKFLEELPTLKRADLRAFLQKGGK